MSIEKRIYNNEAELHSWVETKVQYFFGDVIYLKGFQITTRRNKAGIPDGYILDLTNQSWTIIESELLVHGVWDHIAEQIVRFIVASQNSSLLFPSLLIDIISIPYLFIKNTTLNNSTSHHVTYSGTA